MKSLADQFSAVAGAYPGTTLTSEAGLHLIVIPKVPLPEGWSQPFTHIRFVVPIGYPYAAPDCFWSDENLRLATGALPQNSVPGNLMPGQPDPKTLWFSWHVQGVWNPASCDLMTYVAIIRNRFEARS